MSFVPEFELPADFFNYFISQVEQATESVYIQSLTLEAGQVMDRLGPALLAAAKRGVKVEVHVDWIAKDYVHGKISLTPRFRPSQRKYAAHLHLQNREMVSQLREAGVIISYVNKPDWLARVLAIAGRNHIKMYMVDEKTVWLGGVNVLDAATEHLDFMVAFDNPILIKALKRVFETEKFPDEEITFDPQNTLLIDGGKRRTSIIYAEALKLIHQATHSIVFVSQFVPEGALLKALVTKSKSGCDLKIMTSPVTMMQFAQWPYKITYVKCQQALRAVEEQVIHLPQKVHCKLLLVDNQVGLFGSHNLIETGVNLGTSEVDILTTEPKLIERLIGFVASLDSLHRPIH